MDARIVLTRSYELRGLPMFVVRQLGEPCRKSRSQAPQELLDGLDIHEIGDVAVDVPSLARRDDT